MSQPDKLYKDKLKLLKLLLNSLEWKDIADVVSERYGEEAEKLLAEADERNRPAEG